MNAPPTRGRQRGSVLILMPALVLVLLILGVIAVDSAVAYWGHRQLADLTASAADRSAATAVDKASFYGGHLRIEPGIAQAVAAQEAAVSAGDGGRITSFTATVSPGG